MIVRAVAPRADHVHVFSRYPTITSSGTSLGESFAAPAGIVSQL